MEVKECNDLTEENQFIVDDVSKIIKEAIENSIGGTAYQHTKVNQWTSAVVESCLGQLTKLQKPYKYIALIIIGIFCRIFAHWDRCQIFGFPYLPHFILHMKCQLVCLLVIALALLVHAHGCALTCTIMQKNGAGLHTASSCFWDNNTDGSCTVRWENKTMYCIVSVFGLSI